MSPWRVGADPAPRRLASGTTSATRGVRKLPIVHDDEDRATFLSHLGEVVELFGWELTAFCLMTNHYHLVVRTPAPNIAAGMHRLNLVYAQVFNRKHGFAGHLFDARYWSGVLRTEDYFLDASRYVVLNPVRAELAQEPARMGVVELPPDGRPVAAGAVPEPRLA